MNCPLTNQACPESIDKCSWWTVLRNNNVEVGRCAVAWLPTLLIELRFALPQKEKQEVKDEE